MSVSTKLMTAQELWDLPDHGGRNELIHGELTPMAPTGGEHSYITYRLPLLLGPFIEAHDLGMGFGAEAGFIIGRNPDTILAPDFAFICKDRLTREALPRKFIPLVPDFAVEVLSPYDRAVEVNQKIDQWLAAGVRLLWIVDPNNRTVTAHAPDRQPTVHRVVDTLTGHDVLPGLAIRVADLLR